MTEVVAPHLLFEAVQAMRVSSRGDRVVWRGRPNQEGTRGPDDHYATSEGRVVATFTSRVQALRWLAGLSK